MARSKRPVVKVVLSMAVLATAGAGVYHFRADAWSWLKTLGATPAVQLVADESAGAGSPVTSEANLDAVTSAWADAATSDARPHSAYGTAQEDASKDNAPGAADRYVAPASYMAEETGPASTAAAQASPQDERYETAGLDDDRYVTHNTSPTPLVAANRDAIVTRGQDDENEGAEKLNNDNPLRSTARSTEPSARRAQEAFADEAASSTNDRYIGETPRDNPFRASAAEAPQQVNPFAAQPAPLPSATRAADPITTSREPEFADSPRVSRIPDRTTSLPSASDSGISPTPFSSDSNKYSNDRRSLSPNGLSGTDNSLGGAPGSYGAETEGTGRPGERALEGPQQPSIVIQKFAPPEIQVGKPAKFIVQVQNVGRRPADDVIIHDELPHGTKLVSTSPRADVSGSNLSWQLGTLSAGEQRAVEVQLMPTEEGEIGSVAKVSFSAPASVKTHCTMPQLAIRMTAPSQVMVGEEQRVKIELRNPGSGDATGVMLFENVPQQMKHAAGPTLEFEIGTLRADETRELELIMLAEQAGKVINSLTARADGNLQVEQEVEFEVISPALELAVEGPERRYLERPATYQVTIANPGTAAAKDVEIVTKLPKGMKFIRANNMGEYDASTHAIYWSLAELPEGERGTVELVAMPVESGQHTLEVEGRAERGLTDHTKRDILVEGLAAIMFAVTDLEDPIEVGRDTTYEIRVVNQGTKAATNVQVAVNIPAGMQVVSAGGETRHVVESGGVLFEPLAQLAPKAESVFRVEVQGIRPGDQRVTVEVNTDDTSQPIRKEESTRVFGDE